MTETYLFHFFTFVLFTAQKSRKVEKFMYIFPMLSAETTRTYTRERRKKKNSVIDTHTEKPTYIHPQVLLLSNRVWWYEVAAGLRSRRWLIPTGDIRTCGSWTYSSAASFCFLFLGPEPCLAVQQLPCGIKHSSRSLK